MKSVNWQLVAIQTRELFPNVVQIVSYSRKRWMLVFETEADNFLTTFHPLTGIIRKHKLSTPLIVSKQFILNSLDSYPLEFLDIQSDYTNLFMLEDTIAPLQFEKNDVRLQIERELKSKWLLTRLSAIRHAHKARLLSRLLEDSFTSLLQVFKGFCYLSGSVIPSETDKLIDCLEDILHTDLKVFRYFAGQNKTPSKVLVNNLFNDYIRLLSLCSDKIDEWKI